LRPRFLRHDWKLPASASHSHDFQGQWRLHQNRLDISRRLYCQLVVCRFHEHLFSDDLSATAWRLV